LKDKKKKKMRPSVGPGMSSLAPDPVKKRPAHKLAKLGSHVRAFLSLMGCLPPNFSEKQLVNASSGNPRIQPLVVGKTRFIFFTQKLFINLFFFIKNT
jgi:hypothetical protein